MSVLRRTWMTCLALIVLYFAVPVEPVPITPDGGTRFAVRLGISALALVALIVALRWQLLRHFAQPDAPLGGLVAGVVAGVLLFALTDYAIAVHTTDQFVGLTTRVDALYYALTTLLTIGFGDIMAQGQLARVVLIVQMLFNVLVLATVASFIVSEAGRRARTRRPKSRRTTTRRHTTE